MKLSNIKTISDLLLYSRGILDERPEYMSEQTPYAATIVGLYALPKYGKFEAEYSELTEILDLASDLEISNTANTTVDCGELRDLVDGIDLRKK